VIRREKLFAQISILVFLAATAFKILGAKEFGLPGLAIGSSAGTLLYALALGIAFHRCSKDHYLDKQKAVPLAGVEAKNV